MHFKARLGPHAFPREYIAEESLAIAYDYIIVGGGLAGLVLAARITENPNITVLVVEAGDTGDAVADRINTPAGAYYSSLLYTPYDWQYKTVPQPNAAQRPFDWPRGKVLGGSSAVNAMYLVRPSEIEVNAWRSLIEVEDSESAKIWGWEEFYSAMKKSETFTPPSGDVEQVGNISWSALTHGSSGPMQASYPGMSVLWSQFVGTTLTFVNSMMSQVGAWSASLDTLGLPPLREPNGGTTLGSLVGPLWINPFNWTRSYSKSAYLDPVLSRPNLKVLVNSTATQIVFSDSNSGSQTATGVEFARSRDAPRKIINVNREVILSAGVIGSPQLLMLSGIGPRDILDAVGLVQKVDLPGWANMTRLFGTEGAPSFQGWIADSLEDSADNLVPSEYPEVREGYKAIYDTIANKIMNTEVAVIELLLASNTPGQVGVQAAIQHPLSQGRLYINSSSAFDAPIIDPQYFTHSADLTIMREGIKLARSLKQTPPFSDALGDELLPGPAIVSDQDLEAWLVNQASTQYHPIASCAMLPRSQGGVVNAKLQVYGLANVRVVDSSIYPFEFASHIQFDNAVPQIQLELVDNK
ncbi:hypothetical protein DXG01_017084 [Tephrocybe rancida]|nr:hypothetical protein DXG01_017084 [Tephrocybe rancida]